MCVCYRAGLFHATAQKLHATSQKFGGGLQLICHTLCALVLRVLFCGLFSRHLTPKRPKFGQNAQIWL